MRILAVSDEVAPGLYSPNVAAVTGPIDLVVGCGDLPYYYLECLMDLLNAPLLYIHGNHDPLAEFCGADSSATKSGPDGGEDLDQRCAEVGGLLVAGLGGSVRYHPGAPYQLSQGDMWLRALSLAGRMVPNRLFKGRWLDIMITHSPPLGIHDGKDPAHVGFRAFLPLIHHMRPRYLLHGHQHTNYGPGPRETRLGSTTIVNVHPYRVIEM
jgi:Icc-related predicted phosphoesterase